MVVTSPGGAVWCGAAVAGGCGSGARRVRVALFTAGLLLYACLSAIYYAKFNPILPDYDREYDDYFLERTVGRSARSLDQSEMPSGLSWMNPRTFQFILDAISKHYEEE
ncbi:unnamed protein product [Chrysodeixis includens]|uniref:Uncharacterized protein n=1 Tax=Chrysodeixis includens TaxID=689277 RepID=A0A9N8KPL1_CHRIL|nr:unnamed protein product [Chrysodeixis includens]